MAITLTDVAIKEIKTFIGQQNAGTDEAKQFFLRVGVKGGGCSGMAYTLDLEENKSDSDEGWVYEGVEVICDTRCLLYLDGTSIDFKDEMMGRGFVFNNPNTTSQCGCGSSFQV